MDLVYNADPRFTKYMVESGAMNKPVVVVDVGGYGGENPRWHFLGDQLVLHGFEAIKEDVGWAPALPPRGPQTRAATPAAPPLILIAYGRGSN
jgi:hypothetical protein